MTFLNGCIRAHFNRFRILIFCSSGCHVFRYIHHDWAWTSRSCNIKRLLYCHGQVVHIFDEKIVFDTRSSNANRIHLLKSVIPYQMCGHLGGQHHHRYRIHVGRRNTCNRVGHARARGHQHYSRLTGRAGKTVSRVGGTLLMPHQDMPHLVLLIHRIINMQCCPAGVAK